MFRYDQTGQLLHTEVFSDDGRKRIVHDKLLFTYSKRGELLSETGHLGTLSHRYDELGNRCATTLPDGRTINRLHYGSGHLHQINIDGEVISDFERDDLHREVLRTQGQLTTRFGYDKLGRKTWQDTTKQETHEPVLRKEWEYDRAGELVRKVHSRNGQTRYSYDALGRIVGAMGPAGNEFFTWDAAANLVDTAQVGGYVKYNRVTVYQDKRYDYDVHGRMETKRIGRHTEQDFRYDGEHRLREVHTVRNGVRQVVYFDYDALGRRIRKRDAFGETLFLWDGLQMIQEQRGGNVATYLYEPGTYVPLARVDKATGQQSPFDINLTRLTIEEASQALYFSNDTAGMPNELRTGSGELAWVSECKTWGATSSEIWYQTNKANTNQASSPQNLRFQGQYFDSEIGLHYNTFRYYDPDIGRFINQDPVGLHGGNNLYQYASNSITWINPLGLAVVDAIFQMGGQTFTGVNPTERIPRIPGPTLPGLGYPNNNTFSMHAEFDAMLKAHNEGLRGGTGILTVEGLPLCNFCKRGVKNMATHLGLDEFIIHEKASGNSYKFNGKDLQKVRQGGKGFRGCQT